MWVGGGGWKDEETAKTTAGRQAKGVREGLSAAAAAELSNYNRKKKEAVGPGRPQGEIRDTLVRGRRVDNLRG